LDASQLRLDGTKNPALRVRSRSMIASGGVEEYAEKNLRHCGAIAHESSPCLSGKLASQPKPGKPVRLAVT
jgi:hypothetical protein